MSAFRRLPAELRGELVRLCPGATVHVPKRRYIPSDEIVAAVLTDMEQTGDSQWAAALRVSRKFQLHHLTVFRIARRAWF